MRSWDSLRVRPVQSYHMSNTFSSACLLYKGSNNEFLRIEKNKKAPSTYNYSGWERNNQNIISNSIGGNEKSIWWKGPVCWTVCENLIYLFLQK